MIKKRLFSLVSGASALIAQTVALQWLSLVANAIMVFAIASFLQRLFDSDRGFSAIHLAFMVGVCIMVACVRYLTTLRVGISSHRLAFMVKRSLRERLYVKLLALGPSYTRKLSTSEAVQLAGEGIDQLEVYFSKYLPQLFYCLLAPLTLFALLAFVDIRVALVLLACIPLIPASIMVIQKRAKATFSRYWSDYVDLGAGFLESLQALSTLKVYQADAAHQRQMETDSETFRRATMRVLRLQLSSVTIMDAIAYGGAVLGIILAVLGFQAGTIDFAGCFIVVVLSAEFFIPLRQLGSLFHVAMNGMAASDKIFDLLDLEEPFNGDKDGPSPASVAAPDRGFCVRGLGFSYDGKTPVLSGIDLEASPGAPVALVGASGSGKSTLAALMAGRMGGYTGSLSIAGKEASELGRDALMRTVVLVGDRSHLFKATVRENLLIACPEATDAALWQVLEQVKLAGMLRQEKGLDTPIGEGASDFSGGQRQRLALARALLSGADAYLFDEATSSIDSESEACIMEVIAHIAQSKPVLIVSHRLANVEDASCIYVLDKGRVCERGTHGELLAARGVYARLYAAQRELEDFVSEGSGECGAEGGGLAGSGRRVRGEESEGSEGRESALEAIRLRARPYTPDEEARVCHA
jgi:ABC-type transport system involved in cytochrome bd biosynthesis fused ATPase/permease subunit